MKNVLKCLTFTGFSLFAFLGVPVIVVWSGKLLFDWLGDARWVGLIAAPPILAEVIFLMCFVLWLGPKVGDWTLS